jgi:hypothetical protein
MECSNKEAMTDLVCCIRTLPRHCVHQFGHRFRMDKIGRHQESERCRAGLDELQRYLAPGCYSGT